MVLAKQVAPIKKVRYVKDTSFSSTPMDANQTSILSCTGIDLDILEASSDNWKTKYKLSWFYQFH